MKLIKKLSVTAVVLAMLLCSFTVFVSAATASIAVSSKSPTVGSNITVSVNFGGGSIAATEGTLSYNPAVLQYLSGSDTNGASGAVKFSNYTGRTSYSVSFKVIGVGVSNLVLLDCFIADNNEQIIGRPSASTSINAVAPGGSGTGGNTQQKSSNALLKGIKISGGTLTPAFSPNVFTYSVTLPNSTSVMLVTAYTADSKAKWTVEGDKNMKVGANRRVIVVTAEDGTVKRYTINAERLNEDGTVSSSQVTSSAVQQPDQTPQQNNVTVNINGVDYTVNLSPEKYTVAGFTLQSTEYKGSEIPILKSASGVRLAVLTAPNGSEGLYLLNDDNISFVRAESVKLTGKDYLYIGVLENSDTEKMSKQSKTVAGSEREVYLPDSAAQNSAVVCFYAINEKGELNLYYYDTDGDLLFPYSDIATGKPIAKTEDKTQNKSEKGNDMPLKISLIVSAVLFVAVIILVILLVSAKKKKGKKADDFTPPYIDQDELRF